MELRRSTAAVAVAIAVLVGSVALAQAPGIKRTLLQRLDVEGHDAKECVLGTAELAPGGSVGKHIHHGFELGVVIEGEGELTVEGEAPRKLVPGDSYRVEARRPHDARNTGAGPMKLVATWVVEKGKPLAEPVK
jgi:quercetin dioxygenase-like cupin family protein